MVATQRNAVTGHSLRCFITAVPAPGSSVSTPNACRSRRPFATSRTTASGSHCVTRERNAPSASRRFGGLLGVAAIDEIDAHLHPAWQQRIGDWFVEHFPETQFFVTTHSPIICRAARRGSVWLLPVPGSDEQPRRIKDMN